MNYYNENDPRAAAWLRELIASNLIAPGIVDERSITEVNADELTEYIQCHFFAGIGGWSYALRIAGWSDDRPVWTGSCPCQPFADGGKKGGFADSRHLWPAWFRLIREHWPSTLFGEQVASKDGLAWFDHVSADLEAEAYAVGAADLCAASVGAPHRRQRLFWVADAAGKGGRRRRAVEARHCEAPGGSSANIRAVSWPDHRGGGSTLSVSDILSPSYGIPHRVALLRGYGNAIVPQVAAEFIKAFTECIV